MNQFGDLIDGGLFELPDLPEDEVDSELPNGEQVQREPQQRTLFRDFILSLQEERAHSAPLQIIR